MGNLANFRMKSKLTIQMWQKIKQGNHPANVRETKDIYVYVWF